MSCQTCEELKLVEFDRRICPECVPDLAKVEADLKSTIQGYTDAGLRRIIICQRMIRALETIKSLEKLTLNTIYGSVAESGLRQRS